MVRIKCSVLDRPRERILSRIATRGVVKFFNVCSQEQKDIETQINVVAGNSERKKDKILSSIDKGSFLDRLKEVNKEIENEEMSDFDQNDDQQTKPGWKVLSSDFVMSAKMKDWENDDEDEEENKEDKPKEKDKKKKNNLNKKKKPLIKRS